MPQITIPARADAARTSLRPLQVPLIEAGEDVAPKRAPARLEAARERHAASLAELGLAADDGPDGEIAIPTLTDGAEAAHDEHPADAKALRRRVDELERENAQLRGQVETLQNQLQRLRG